MLSRRLEAAGGARGHADVARRPDLAVDVVGKSLEAEQAVDGRHERHVGVAGDVLFDGAERGASEQVLDVLFASPGHGLVLPNTRDAAGGRF